MCAALTLLSTTRFYKRFGPRYWIEGAGIEGLPPWRRALDIAQGHSPREADWYRQRRGGARGCTTNLDREMGLHRVNRHYGYVLDDKAVFADLCAHRGMPTPRIAARAVDGVWRWAAGGREALGQSLRVHGRIVVKPTLGGKGAEVRVLRELAAMDPPPATDTIATPFVRQHDYAEAIFPNALNTLRVLMVRDADGPFVAAATHRFGTSGSGVTDNFSQGGLVAELDMASGRLGTALSVGPRNQLLEHGTHPDTGARIGGVVVPDWGGLRTLVDRLAEAFPELRYAGWDIAMTAEGPVVIEGNSHPSLRFFQLFEPILDRPRLAAFLAPYLPVARRTSGRRRVAGS